MNAYIDVSDDLGRRINFIVERGNYYHGGPDDFTYWDSNVFGFTFKDNLFKELFCDEEAEKFQDKEED